jgi:hypothetical protein
MIRDLGSKFVRNVNNACFFVVYFIQLCPYLNCIASNGRMIGEWWVEKDLEWSAGGLMWGARQVFAWKDRKTAINLFENSRCPDGDSKRAPPSTGLRALRLHNCAQYIMSYLGLALLCIYIIFTFGFIMCPNDCEVILTRRPPCTPRKIGVIR